MRLAWLQRTKFHHIVRASVLLASSSLCLQPLRAEIPWRDQLTTAHAEAKAQGKPLLLHFYTDNCVYCDKLEAGAFQSADVESAVAQGFVPVKVHAKESPELVKMFKVTKFPMDVVVTSAGETLMHSVSPQDPKKYVSMLAHASSKVPAAMPAQAAPQPKTQLAADPAVQAEPPSMPVDQSGNLPVENAVAATPATDNNAAADPGMGIPAEAMPGGGKASLASARLNNEMPTDSGQQASLAAETDAADGSPKLAMEGFCAVTVIDDDQWIEGNPKFGVVHLGNLYLFSSAEKMDVFLADPMRYTPVLNEIDVVRFFEERRIVPGQRRFGMRDPIHQRMFFFADEASMNHFFDEYERYTDAAIEVMDRAVADANPAR
ncbi:thioredoxin family protein [Allorhodopirellula solitaria]|uniref:Thiol:disulfide interchange protein n=1 Tax=Allorhodopirellula solitaria TaxID=2527987 RepID=A0A5C5YKF4_9BACT|nr:thioredoxin family protein [Allorhodopirellula solitaria]TWT75405.1 thiol:disulfide interchange protein precursor [Allorhodopirellula solitaria]